MNINSEAFVSWKQFDLGQSIRVRWTSNGVWQPEATLAHDLDHSFWGFPINAITSDSQGQVTVTWVVRDPIDNLFDLVYRVFDGAIWESEKIIRSDMPNADTPFILTDRFNNRHIFWSEMDATSGLWQIVHSIIYNTPEGSSISVSPSSRTTITFANVSSAGSTTVATSSGGPSLPAGFSLGNPPTYYDIGTTAIYLSPVTVCITYDPGQYNNPNSLHLLHYESDAWIDTTTSNDIINNVICGEVNNLSPFVIAQFNYNFSGFFQPVDNLPTLNMVKAGSAIPVKFSLGGEQGLDIFEAAYPKSQTISCDSTAPVDFSMTPAVTCIFTYGRPIRCG